MLSQPDGSTREVEVKSRRSTFPLTENLWWALFSGSSGPFHVSCSAVCNYGGMQADRYHLTPLAPLPGSAIVTRTKLAEESSRKGQKDFVLLMLLSVNASELSPYPD